MIFSDGYKKAGKFNSNKYEGPLETIEEAKEIEEEYQVELPNMFKEELKEYIEVIEPIQKIRESDLKKEGKAKIERKFNEVEKEVKPLDTKLLDL